MKGLPLPAPFGDFPIPWIQQCKRQGMCWESKRLPWKTPALAWHQWAPFTTDSWHLKSVLTVGVHGRTSCTAYLDSQWTYRECSSIGWKMAKKWKLEAWNSKVLTSILDLSPQCLATLEAWLEETGGLPVTTAGALHSTECEAWLCRWCFFKMPFFLSSFQHAIL